MKNRAPNKHRPHRRIYYYLLYNFDSTSLSIISKISGWKKKAINSEKAQQK